MKRFCSFIMLVSCFILPYAHAGQMVPSQIKEVTLFSALGSMKAAHHQVSTASPFPLPSSTGIQIVKVLPRPTSL
jgi:hypothetical protein